MAQGYSPHSFLHNFLVVLFSTFSGLIGQNIFVLSVFAQFGPPLLSPHSPTLRDLDFNADFSEDSFLQRTAEGCSLGTFLHVGKGGLPPQPTDLLTFPAVWHDLRQLPRPLLRNSQPRLTKASIPKLEIPVEAQSWQVQENETLVLITTNPILEFSALTEILHHSQ